MVHGARGSVPPSLPRARGVLPHSRESCASSNRTSRFKSENRLHRCSRRRESSGRRPDEYLAAVRRRRWNAAPSRRRGDPRAYKKNLTPHRARFAFDWGEYPGGDAGTGMYSKRTGACDWK
jgi:hypothetical protein